MIDKNNLFIQSGEEGDELILLKVSMTALADLIAAYRHSDLGAHTAYLQDQQDLHTAKIVAILGRDLPVNESAQWLLTHILCLLRNLCVACAECRDQLLSTDIFHALDNVRTFTLLFWLSYEYS